MKSNPPALNPALAGFHRAAISSTVVDLFRARADLVEKDPELFPILSLFLEQMTGIEPAYLAWEASALPLSYNRIT